MPATRPILVTGVTGFVGRRVAELWPHCVHWPKVDLRDREQVESGVRRLLQESPFDDVLHLAGISSIWNSFDDPVLMYEVNLMGTVHLLQALTNASWRGRFLFASSGAVYGDPDKVLVPLREDALVAPSSPYAASKVAGEQAVLEWGRREHGGCALVARCSNHAGPGQSSHFFLSSMAKQIAAVPRGESVVIETGNLSPYRDFLHVDDVIDAYQAILDLGRSGAVYNVATGRSLPLSEILRGLSATSGRKVETRLRSERFRAEPSRPLEISIERLQRDTGWTATRGLEQIYSDLIHFWEARHEEESTDHGDLGPGRRLS
jgi:GDP-4-dehydro-6-deoxy-D-mannose reductase